MTILLLISCKNSKKTETENNSESKYELTQSDFKKVESNNSLNLEYRLLDINDELIEVPEYVKMAEFPGGFDSLTNFIQHKFKFDEGHINKIKGKVKSTFVVDTSGKVVDIKIIERLRKDYDTACYKVISKIPDWKPAELKKQKIKVQFILPFRFEADK